jgi:hypothetical protein
LVALVQFNLGVLLRPSYRDKRKLSGVLCILMSLIQPDYKVIVVSRLFRKY